MFTPRVSEASPRASRLDATSTSCTDVTPRPPSSSGIGAVKYPLCLTAGEALEGEAPVAVVGGGARADLVGERLGERDEALARLGAGCQLGRHLRLLSVVLAC